MRPTNVAALGPSSAPPAAGAIELEDASGDWQHEDASGAWFWG